MRTWLAVVVLFCLVSVSQAQWVAPNMYVSNGESHPANPYVGVYWPSANYNYGGYYRGYGYGYPAIVNSYGIGNQTYSYGNVGGVPLYGQSLHFNNGYSQSQLRIGNYAIQSNSYRPHVPTRRFHR